MIVWNGLPDTERETIKALMQARKRRVAPQLGQPAHQPGCAVFLQGTNPQRPQDTKSSQA